jgi:cellulose synthase/poly-beta-1,6-N-acetylglucosamine synthase-like glycosyltransferase
LQRVTIGIPSFNEESNIISLLDAIISGYNESFLINKIIISDDSTDDTSNKIERYIKMHTDIPIELCHSSLRGGAANAWNNIIKKADGDVLVLYDADIIPLPNSTKELVTKIKDNIGICASNPKPFHEEGIVAKSSRCISTWLEMVRRKQVSQYTVMGRALSIPVRLAKKIEIPTNLIAIDLYLQIKVLEMGYRIVYNSNAIVMFRPPTDLLDFTSQNIRAINGHNQILTKYEDQNRISLKNILYTSLATVIKDPVGAICLATCWFFVPFYQFRIKGTNSALWHTAASTKS